MEREHRLLQSLYKSTHDTKIIEHILYYMMIESRRRRITRSGTASCFCTCLCATLCPQSLSHGMQCVYGYRILWNAIARRRCTVQNVFNKKAASLAAARMFGGSQGRFFEDIFKKLFIFLGPCRRASAHIPVPIIELLVASVRHRPGESSALLSVA